MLCRWRIPAGGKGQGFSFDHVFGPSTMPGCCVLAKCLSWCRAPWTATRCASVWLQVARDLQLKLLSTAQLMLQMAVKSKYYLCASCCQLWAVMRHALWEDSTCLKERVELAGVLHVEAISQDQANQHQIAPQLSKSSCPFSSVVACIIGRLKPVQDWPSSGALHSLTQVLHRCACSAMLSDWGWEDIHHGGGQGSAEQQGIIPRTKLRRSGAQLCLMMADTSACPCPLSGYAAHRCSFAILGLCATWLQPQTTDCCLMCGNCAPLCTLPRARPGCSRQRRAPKSCLTLCLAARAGACVCKMGANESEPKQDSRQLLPACSLMGSTSPASWVCQQHCDILIS